MASEDEKHREKTPSSLSSSGTAESEILESKEFTPIKSSGRTHSRSNSQTQKNRPASLRAISRTRSQNGYGCDDVNDDVEEGASAESRAAIEKDQYEVGWDDGENDPMNPRGMSLARKWVVVIVVSASSLCV